MGRVGGRSALLAVTISLLAAPAAVAGGVLTTLPSQFAPGFEHAAGPAFAGDAVALATPSAGGSGGFDVTVDSGGTLSTTTARTSPGNARAVFAASPTHAALAVNVQTCADGEACKYGAYDLVESDVFAAPLGEQLTYRDCGSGLVDLYVGDGLESVDVSGSVLAYRDGCAGGVVVRDLAAPASTPWKVFPAKDRARISGGYLAVDSLDPSYLADEQRPERVTVYDWRSGQVVFSVDGVPPFDVEDDGTIAYTTLTPTRSLAWASPAAPTPHPLPESAAWDVRVADGRVAVRTQQRFSVFDLTGAQLATTPATDAVADFDFDGSRLAYASQPCEVIGIVTWDLAGAPPGFPPGDCPAAAASAAVADLRRRVLRVPVRCPPSPPLGCTGDWSVILRRPQFDALPGQWGALGPGQSATLRLRLSRHQACAFARHLVRRAIADFLSYTSRPSMRPRAVRLRVRTIGRPRGCV